MKKLLKKLLLLMLVSSPVLAQKPTQTIRGTVLDNDNRLPLAGVSVLIAGSNAVKGSNTDAQGRFRMEDVPVGKITLSVSLVGFEPLIIPDIEVNAGKEVVLNLIMQENIRLLGEFVVKAVKNKGEALNKMSLISARSVSLEETKRYAGGFNDPSRILSAFAGVGNSQNGDNDIIVRGNAPKYLQWRLEGVEITNPNHLADQNAVTGGISALNNNLLATSDFYSGAFSAEYGDVLSGVLDVRLRSGNNEKFETSVGLGILGSDIMAEGPFKKGYGGSFLVNYRYSTVSLVHKMGLIDIGGVPDFQDAAFKVVLPTKKAGSFSLFGLGGLSRFYIKDVKPQIWETPGDRGQREDITEDFSKKNFLVHTGLNHTLPMSKNAYFHTTLAYSNTGSDDRTIEFIKDSTGNQISFKSKLMKSTYRAATALHYKISARHKIEMGIKYALFGYDYGQSLLSNTTGKLTPVIDFRENIGTLRNYLSWRYRVSENITLVSGLHQMTVLYNKKSAVEPRIALKWQLNDGNALSAGYGKHSTMESIPNYFARVQQPDGSFTEPNKDLDLLKAHHFVLGYEKRFSDKFMIKAETYYQSLYHLPVENSLSSSYSTINESLEFKYVDLVNKGTGENYGVELTLERFLANNFYFILNGSLFNSTYKALDGVKRNTSFNSRYMGNFLIGKEFMNLGKKDNKSLSLNAKLFYGGPRRFIPLLRGEDGKLAVNPKENKYWDYGKAYQASLDDIFSASVSVSYKIHKRKLTHELYLNIDNVTNNISRLTEYYDTSEPGSTGYVKQLGAFPNLLYRIYL